jgi:hypothetical protein
MLPALVIEVAQETELAARLQPGRRLQWNGELRSDRAWHDALMSSGETGQLDRDFVAVIHVGP